MCRTDQRSHSPVLAGTQPAHCSVPCPPRRPATAPFPAAAGSPTTSPCVAPAPPPPHRRRTVASAHVPACRPAVPRHAHTALFSRHPLHTCPVVSTPGTPALPRPRSSHASHTSLECRCSHYPPVSARCAHLQYLTFAPPVLIIKILALARPLGAIRQCRTARSGHVQTWLRSVPCSPVSTAVVCRQAVLARSWCKPVTTAHTATHQLFLARSSCAIQPTKPPRTAVCGQQLLLHVALASAPLLHTHLHSTNCTVTGPGPEPCCVSSCSCWGGGADSASSPSFTRLLPLQAVSSGEDVGSM
ncbi:uncharacterized protein LOC110581148 [Neomonachus schauinslandi]|uniref:Uncharacterized protein LOC110581148 n=1 Tax=Neomonachus schauinslandi TaxID=29088 RepID=A0A2Y9H4N1_NEOSC|nr:uncharacterized protein LOC110581148 [Neomonachus schauinslandi]